MHRNDIRPWTEKYNQYNMKNNQAQSGRLSTFLQAVREFFYGMAGMEFAGHAMEMRASLESIFMLGTVGDIIGVPVLPPYYRRFSFSFHKSTKRRMTPT
jgi:hypothetical protein